MDLKRAAELGYKVNEIDTDIYIIEDFITEEERLSIYDRAISAPEEEWQNTFIKNYIEQSPLKNNPEALAEDIAEVKLRNKLSDKVVMFSNKSIEKGIHSRMRDILGNKDLYVNGSAIQRHYSGSYLQEHYDSHGKPALKYASIIYLNDDYIGGSLYFPDRGIEFRPPIRSLVVFNSGPEYVHGVRRVEDGPIRYVFVSFVWLEQRPGFKSSSAD
jgi:hypothetical protein